MILVPLPMESNDVDILQSLYLVTCGYKAMVCNCLWLL